MLAYDSFRVTPGLIPYGSGMATPLAAGMAAVRMQASQSRRDFIHAMEQQVGKVLSAAP
jgi:hypothetical protein